MKNMSETYNANKMQYKKLVWMIILSFIAMFTLMYSMVDKLENVTININQFYMAGLMTAPMIIIEIALMGNMYMNKKLNLIIIAVSAVVLVACFLFIRNQMWVSDKQFVRSMIPHHAAALLMAKEADIKDPEIKTLINNIISSQQKEIDFMKAKLKETGNK